MLFSYKECLEKYHSPYQIRKAVENGSLFMVQKGIYSDQENNSELAVISLKYPKAVFTMRNAFYYHGLTDVIPDGYDLATERDAAKIRNKSVKQFFYPPSFFKQGISEMDYQGTRIRIYDRERMLVELIRFKSKLPYDYYKELISSYRNILPELDIERIENYSEDAPHSDSVIRILQTEVF